MAKAKENLKIEVHEVTAGEVRTITVIIEAPAKDFLLPDLLSQRGAVSPFEVTLKQAVREATERYLAGTEDLIAGLAASQKSDAPASKPKLNGNGKGTKSAASKREAAAAQKPAMPPEPQPVSAAVVLSAAGD
jgi:hypothetical protein